MLAAQQNETLSLNGGWQFRQVNKSGQNRAADSSAGEWYAAEVPGSVQRDLIRHGLLPDPYYGTNEKKVQWVENENWDFKKTFLVSAAQLQHDDAVIFFVGTRYPRRCVSERLTHPAIQQHVHQP